MALQVPQGDQHNTYANNSHTRRTRGKRHLRTIPSRRNKLRRTTIRRKGRRLLTWKDLFLPLAACPQQYKTKSWGLCSGLALVGLFNNL